MTNIWTNYIGCRLKIIGVSNRIDITVLTRMKTRVERLGKDLKLVKSRLDEVDEKLENMKAKMENLERNVETVKNYLGELREMTMNKEVPSGD